MSAHRVAAVTFAAVLIVATFGPVGTSSASEVYALDEDNPLATEAAVENFNTDGVAGGVVSGLDMRLTLAEQHNTVDADGFHSNIGRSYLRIQYNESIQRTIRFYIPSAMVYPHIKQDLESITDDTTADLEPADGGEYTAVTVTVDGETDAVFPINKVASSLFQVKDATSSRVENFTGISLPSVLGGGGTEWQYVNESALAGNETTVAIEQPDEGLTVQFDSTPTATGESWINTPACSDSSSTPVCSFERSGDDKLYVLSRSDDAPAIRYRAGGAPMFGVESALNDLERAADRFLEDINALTGGLFG